MAQRTEAIYQGMTILDISFDQAWKAAGLSSNMDDYFDRKDAVLVAMK